MSKAQDAVIAIAAQRLALIEGEQRGDLLAHSGFARLVFAMFDDCRGAEPCRTCTLEGLRVCPYETQDDPISCELLTRPAA